MKILLLGEFSNLHNSLKQGLLQNNHQVTLVNNGDAFKNYPADISIRATFTQTLVGRILRFFLQKIFNTNLLLLEHGIRFWFISNKLKNYDVVQLINQKPIQTLPWLELFLLKKISKQNKNIFLLSCGIDYYTVTHMMQQTDKYNIMQPYFENKTETQHQYRYYFDYLSKSHLKIHHFLEQNIKGIIASDFDYVAPIKNHKKYLGIIPNPINVDVLQQNNKKTNTKIVIFLGVNTGNSIKKGIVYFEKALEIVKTKYPNKIKIIITKNLPYHTYKTYFDKADILLDQVFCFDQGYNALEAMAKGKVVFTGAETEFLNQYHLQEDEVAINALPNADYLVEKLSNLIENPSKIKEIGQNAANFIKKEHHYIKIAQKYIATWQAHF